MRDRVLVQLTHGGEAQVPESLSKLRQQCKCYRSEGREFPGASGTALKRTVSWKSHNTTKLTQKIYWERHKMVAASTWARNSRELSRRQV